VVRSRSRVVKATWTTGIETVVTLAMLVEMGCPSL
jgi:hypothetical protein